MTEDRGRGKQKSGLSKLRPMSHLEPAQWGFPFGPWTSQLPPPPLVFFLGAS